VADSLDLEGEVSLDRHLSLRQVLGF